MDRTRWERAGDEHAHRLWRDLLALPDGPRSAVLRHLGRGEPLDRIGEQDLRRALAALAVEEDLSPRVPAPTRDGLAALLRTRADEVEQALAEPAVEEHPVPAPATTPSEPPTRLRRRPSRRALVTAVLSLAAAGGIAAVVLPAVATLRDGIPDQAVPAETSTGTTAPVPGEPVVDVATIAGRWEPADGGAGEAPGAADHAPYLEFTRFGHWEARDGCGGSLRGYLALAGSGRVDASVEADGVQVAVDRCVPVPVVVGISGEQRRLVLQGEQLVAVNGRGGVVARFDRTAQAPEPTYVRDVAAVAGSWKQTGVRGALAQLGSVLPLRDVLTIEPATVAGLADTTSAGTWEARSDACVVTGGPLRVTAAAEVSFARTFRTDQSCSGTPGTLRWQLQEAAFLVLENPQTLVVIDSRGRESARLEALDPPPAE